MAIGALAVVLLMVVVYVVTTNGIDDAKEKTAKAQNETAVAQAKIGQLQAYGDFAALKTSHETAVKSVAEVRFDYERLMREIALVLPHNTYLTTFAAAPGGAAAAASSGAATATGPTITVAGCSPSHPDVATAIVRLRKLHNVTSVDLASSAKAGSGTGGTGGTGGTASHAICKVSWNATLVFKAETAPTAGTGTQPVPARLGGGQ